MDPFIPNPVIAKTMKIHLGRAFDHGWFHAPWYSSWTLLDKTAIEIWSRPGTDTQLHFSWTSQIITLLCRLQKARTSDTEKSCWHKVNSYILKEKKSTLDECFAPHGHSISDLITRTKDGFVLGPAFSMRKTNLATSTRFVGKEMVNQGMILPLEKLLRYSLYCLYLP